MWLWIVLSVTYVVGKQTTVEEDKGSFFGNRSVCGLTPVKPSTVRIVGGQPAVPYSWPWQAEICVRAQQMVTVDGDVNVRKGERSACRLRCGGSLIDNQWVITAGHCAAGAIDSPEIMGVKLGTYDYRSDDEEGEIFSTVMEVIRHPKFAHPHIYSHDVALLKLEKPVEYTDHIQPVCIPKKNDHLKKGVKAYVTGWGTTSEGGPVSTTLRQVSVPLLDMKECEREYRGQIDETMECAGRTGHDSCQGDSGGPLVTHTRKDQRWFQVGLVSWGEGCAERGHAGVYSRTSAYCDFFKQHVGREICTH